jgi:hypothetical protein
MNQAKQNGSNAEQIRRYLFNTPVYLEAILQLLTTISMCNMDMQIAVQVKFDKYGNLRGS